MNQKKIRQTSLWRQPTPTIIPAIDLQLSEQVIKQFQPRLGLLLGVARHRYRLPDYSKSPRGTVWWHSARKPSAQEKTSSGIVTSPLIVHDPRAKLECYRCGAVLRAGREFLRLVLAFFVLSPIAAVCGIASSGAAASSSSHTCSLSHSSNSAASLGIRSYPAASRFSHLFFGFVPLHNLSTQ